MLLLTTSVFECLRFIAPLNVSATEIELCLSTFAAALDDHLAATHAKWRPAPL
jgi:hypothetical protein